MLGNKEVKKMETYLYIASAPPLYVRQVLFNQEVSTFPQKHITNV